MASAGSIEVSWTAPEGSIVATYEIEYGVADETERQTTSVSGDQTVFSHTGNQGDTKYRYQVRAVNAAGTSAWTNSVTAMRTVPPGKPTDVSTTISGDNIVVSWMGPATGLIDGYHVELRQQDLQNWIRHVQPGTGTSYTHASPDAGTTYEYHVTDLQRRRRQQLELQGHRHLVRGRSPTNVGQRPALEQQHATADPVDPIGNQRGDRLRGQAPRGRRRMVHRDHHRDVHLP